MRKIVVIFFVLWFCPASTVWAASKTSDVKSGNKAYLKGEYEAAIEKYEKALVKDPESPIINYDLGTTYYKLGKYEQAVEHLQKSLLSDDPKLQEKARYNISHVLYSKGLEAEKQDNVEKAIADVETALKQLEQVIKLNDKDKDAKYNYEIIKKKLEELKKKRKPKAKKQGNNENREFDNGGPNPQQSSGGQGNQKENNSTLEKENKDSENKEQQQNSPDKQQEQSKDSAQKKNQSAGEQESAQRMTDQEADMMLKNYQQAEEPQGLLNFMNRTRPEVPVSKDW